MSGGEPSFVAGRGAGRRSDRWNRRGGVDMLFRSSHSGTSQPRRERGPEHQVVCSPTGFSFTVRTGGLAPSTVAAANARSCPARAPSGSEMLLPARLAKRVCAWATRLSVRQRGAAASDSATGHTPSWAPVAATDWAAHPGHPHRPPDHHHQRWKCKQRKQRPPTGEGGKNDKLPSPRRRRRSAHRSWLGTRFGATLQSPCPVTHRLGLRR